MSEPGRIDPERRAALPSMQRRAERERRITLVLFGVAILVSAIGLAALATALLA